MLHETLFSYIRVFIRKGYVCICILESDIKDFETVGCSQKGMKFTVKKLKFWLLVFQIQSRMWQIKKV